MEPASTPSTTIALLVLLLSRTSGRSLTSKFASQRVFASIGVTGTNTSLFTTGIFGIIKFLGAIVWLIWLVDRFGRRTMLFVGSVGGAISMFAIGAYIAIAQPTKPENVSDKLSSGGIVAMFFFYLWTVFYSPTWNGTVSHALCDCSRHFADRSRLSHGFTELKSSRRTFVPPPSPSSPLPTGYSPS
jgi:hypothetical protein